MVLLGWGLGVLLGGMSLAAFWMALRALGVIQGRRGAVEFRAAFPYNPEPLKDPGKARISTADFTRHRVGRPPMRRYTIYEDGFDAHRE